MKVRTVYCYLGLWLLKIRTMSGGIFTKFYPPWVPSDDDASIDPAGEFVKILRMTLATSEGVSTKVCLEVEH